MPIGDANRIIDYDYSYCRTKHAYFTDLVLDSTTKRRDSQVDIECSLYEYRTNNYPKCMPTAPGFISPGNSDLTALHKTATEKPAGPGGATTYDNSRSDVYTQLHRHGRTQTSIVVRSCPEYSRLFMMLGGIDEHHACRIREMGECQTDIADFCTDG